MNRSHAGLAPTGDDECRFLRGPQPRWSDIGHVASIVREYVQGLRAMRSIGPAITVFGSARLGADTAAYCTARAVGARLAEAEQQPNRYWDLTAVCCHRDKSPSRWAGQGPRPQAGPPPKPGDAGLGRRDRMRRPGGTPPPGNRRPAPPARSPHSPQPPAVRVGPLVDPRRDLGPAAAEAARQSGEPRLASSSGPPIEGR